MSDGTPASEVDERQSGLVIGRVRGVPVILAPSWFVVALIVVALFGPTVRSSLPDLPAPAAYAVALAYALLLLVSVLLHEAAHAVAARRLGMPVTRVVADLWGGHTAFGADARTPAASAMVSVVGPLTNLAIAAMAYPLQASVPYGVRHLLLTALMLTNGFVGVFNLLPGLPLDGGRLVEAGVWAVSRSRHLGTVVAGWCGRVVAVLVLAWGVLLPLVRGGSPSLSSVIWSAMIAALLWQGASGAIAVGGVRRRAAGLDAARLLRPARALPADAPASRAAEVLAARPGTVVVVTGPSGRPEALVDEAALARLPAGGGDDVPVSAVSTRLPAGAVLPSGADGERLLRAVAETPAVLYVVVDVTGQVVGVMAGQEIADALTGRR